ncbi:gtp-binding protein [Stemphylium lycopersici]|uniref:Gtp-binding protein n=1 Tax=Stemphylium lycopersici TaxID=183478 RepID=A0A364N364_STELY|nr:gtp-binding protein [Stemphylium lycopersici]RAR04369.1 gtp-binding protein [Stemphylium lycopersici]RAR10796.1 gtp-binding protein [Stemphylium lycopersici]
MRPALRQARTLLNHEASVPVFLCPALLRTPITAPRRHPPQVQSSRNLSASRRRREQTSAPALPAEQAGASTQNGAPAETSLPRSCPGCGAPTQLYDKKEAGYYNIDRKAIRDYLNWAPNRPKDATVEDHVYENALKNINPDLLGELGIADEGNHVPEDNTAPPPTPVCERCHNLLHHRLGSPIHHPTVESIQQTIAESPHRRNHIYHVVDAADFPLSIVPNLQSSLRIPKLRTQNRRAKHKGWVANDRIAEVSFIVTRADLLAPKKEQVDVLMPYIRDVLRDALGRQNANARLGNVRLVSAKRGWWTKQVKEDIWERGGAGWMVGKVNVGKSNLFEAVFPKGRGADYQEVRKIRSAAEREAMLSAAKSLEELLEVQKQLADEDAETERLKSKPQEHLHQPPAELEEPPEEEDFDDPDALLPPPQPYTPFPILPIASSLPGTTASPIRIPFGHNRGELIDLPGLARTTPGLETFVQPTAHDDLVMKTRINSDRYTLKPGQSLILGGGLIRLTPVTHDLVFLVYPFVPLHPHVTRTEKAEDYQRQTSDRQLQVAPILAPNVGSKMNSAGKFQLKWDVTKKLAGPVTSPVAGKMKPENLPFRIWGTDILVEGVGWIEISAQTRRPQGWKPSGLVKKDPNQAKFDRITRLQQEQDRKQRKFDAIARAEREGRDVAEVLEEEFYEDHRRDEMEAWEEDYPEIEVFSPLGKFVGQRRPMCASTVSGPKQIASRDRKMRPRRSMVSVKRQRKPKGAE